MLFELWCWRRLLRVPWTARRSNQSILKETSWVFIGRTDAEAETPIFWSPNAKSWLFGKDPDAGKDWRREEKGTTEDEMAGWHHRLDGHEFGWTPGVGDGQGGLACCDSWSRKASEKTYSSCRFTQFRNKHFRHLPFLSEHFRDISVLSDKASAVDNQRPEAVGGQAHVALSLTYYCFDWILEWVAMPFSRRPSQPRDQNWNSCILGGFFTIWATRESRLIHSSFYLLEPAEISIVNFQPPF